MADRIFYNSSGRSIVYGTKGMIATSQPLASAAGLKILMQGGNAVDAAIAANAVLGVVEPFMCGVGGDLFTLIWDNNRKELIGYNGSGRLGSKAYSNLLIDKGYTKMPLRGIYTVTVPGTVDAWCRLLEDYGTMGLDELLAPAIDYAENGFPVSEIIAYEWKETLVKLEKCPTAMAIYSIRGRAPVAGEIMKNQALGSDLKLLAGQGRNVFYEGILAEKICTFLKHMGSSITYEDFKYHTGEYVKPIKANYQGYEIFELPPNGQGAMVLEMLNILEGYDLPVLGHNSAEYIHFLVETIKLAFRDRSLYIADPAFNDLPVERLISKEYARQQRKMINSAQAASLHYGNLSTSDTVYLSVADENGNCISLINSIYKAFGSGLVPNGTGILLQNRGSLFSLDPGNCNYLEPQKRPLHTIIPAMVLLESKPCFCFGVMGGDMQLQGHVQILLNMIDFDFDIQKAGEIDRIRYTDAGVALESGIGWQEKSKLLDKGHKINPGPVTFGGYQGIYLDQKSGVLAGASDPRKDGCAMGI